MINQSQACDPRVHRAAIGMARRCRHVIQACLREEEWGDADFEFYMIIREGVERCIIEVREPSAQAANQPTVMHSADES